MPPALSFELLVAASIFYHQHVCTPVELPLRLATGLPNIVLRFIERCIDQIDVCCVAVVVPFYFRE